MAILLVINCTVVARDVGLVTVPTGEFSKEKLQHILIRGVVWAVFGDPTFPELIHVPRFPLLHRERRSRSIITKVDDLFITRYLAGDSKRKGYRWCARFYVCGFFCLSSSQDGTGTFATGVPFGDSGLGFRCGFSCAGLAGRFAGDYAGSFAGEYAGGYAGGYATRYDA